MQLEYPGVVGSGELYLKVLKAICGDTAGKSMVDLMCYHAPYTPLLGFNKRTYLDIQDRGLDHKEEQSFFKQVDVLEYLSNSYCQYFDVAICSDGIEHLEEFHGLFLIKKMYMHSKKQILFTPLGDLNLSAEKHPDSHRSGWTPEKIEYMIPGSSHFAYIIFPNFHPTLNTGAFFFWHCNNIQQDFERVKNELNELGR